LSTICQLHDWTGQHYTQGFKTVRVSIDPAMSRTLPSQVEGRARQRKTLQRCGTSGKSFLVSLRGRSSVGWNAASSLVRIPHYHGPFPRSSTIPEGAPQTV
jgi:hypothetical protein